MIFLLISMLITCQIDAMHSLLKTINDFEGKIGLHAINLATNQEIAVHPDEYFPMASTRKIMLACYLFDLIDKKKLSLDNEVSIGNKDVVPGSGIIKNQFHVANTVRKYEVKNLLELMMTESDNTAADVLMKLGGGHEKVDEWLTDNHIQNIHFRTDIKSWLSKEAIKTLPYKEAQDAIMASQQAPWYYKAIARGASWMSQPDHIDFSDETTNIATPRAVTQFLIQCYKGEAPGLHDDDHRSTLLHLMNRCRTGENRMPKYLPSSALVMHKTGTGIMGICNDAGIVASPDKALAMTIFIKDSIKPMPELEEAIAKIAKSVYDAL